MAGMDWALDIIGRGEVGRAAPPSPHLRNALSPATINQSKGGSRAGTTSTGGVKYGLEDYPKLAMAIRVSMDGGAR